MDAQLRLPQKDLTVNQELWYPGNQPPWLQISRNSWELPRLGAVRGEGEAGTSQPDSIIFESALLTFLPGPHGLSKGLPTSSSSPLSKGRGLPGLGPAVSPAQLRGSGWEASDHPSLCEEGKENRSQAAKMQGLWGHLRNNSSCGSLFKDSRTYWGSPGGNSGKEPAC